MRVLDCAGAVVTATVSESIYNKLWIGQPAKFQLRGMSEAYAGTVVGLTGLTAAGSNYAIDQTAMTREPYHVDDLRAGIGSPPRVQCRAHRQSDFRHIRGLGPRPRRRRQKCHQYAAANPKAPMTAASGISYWEAFAPGLALVLMAAAVLPWLNRNNTIARTLVVVICLVLGWRYMLWRITDTLPPAGLTLDFGLGVLFTLVETHVDAGRVPGAGLSDAHAQSKQRSRPEHSLAQIASQAAARRRPHLHLQ